tara:strand:+ start:133 stop:264 length:132 start_codon:yes stop_codon:yes gene_type:complete
LINLLPVEPMRRFELQAFSCTKVEKQYNKTRTTFAVVVGRCTD